MNRRRGGVLFLGIFLSYLFVALFINFFHTEKTPDANGSCPACQFQKSSLAAGLVSAIVLPQPALLEILVSREAELKSSSVIFDLVSRSPPLP